MSFIPAFDIGVWNAWIFILIFLLIAYGGSSFFVSKESALWSWIPDKGARRLFPIQGLTTAAFCIYSIFLPLKLGTTWFYAGLLIYLAGMIILTISVVNFATTPVDKPVTKGVYHISRHPMYLGSVLIFIGVGIAGASWIPLLLTMILIIVLTILAIPEERFCLDKYGDAYREYMNRTPRWVGIPKPGKN